MNIVDLHSIMNHWRAIYKVLEEDWQKSAQDIGLTLAEQHTIWIVYFEKEATMTRIAELGLWDISTVMQVVSRLKKKELVKVSKNKEDQRKTYVSLTEKGQEKRLQSAQYQHRVIDFLQQYENEGRITELQELKKFQEAFNEHFYGRNFVHWVEKAGKSLKNSEQQ